jgi:hypothetical protein
VKEGDTHSFAVERKDLASHSKLAADQSKVLDTKNSVLNTPIKLQIETDSATTREACVFMDVDVFFAMITVSRRAQFEVISIQKISGTPAHEGVHADG